MKGMAYAICAGLLAVTGGCTAPNPTRCAVAGRVAALPQPDRFGFVNYIITAPRVLK